MKKQSDYYLFFFYKIKGLGLKTIYHYLKQFVSAEAFYLAVQNHNHSIDPKTASIIRQQQANTNWLNEIKNEWQNLSGEYCTILDNDYPALLKNIYDPPLFLFYQGNIKLLTSQYLLTIVGSRTLSSYHQNIVQKISQQLSGTPLVLVSGLALGIDSQVHQAALSNHLPTVAVLGSGIDPQVLYPASNKKLAQKIIADGGLIVSEYPPETPAATYQFPKRNRILAGISPLTIIISGAKKSGTLITAQLALDSGREVYALPGNINQALCEGPNQLLAQGAQILLGVEDILNFYHLNKRGKTATLSLNKQENNIIKILNVEPLTKEKLAQKLQLSLSELQTIISNLELLGLVKTNIFNELEII